MKDLWTGDFANDRLILMAAQLTDAAQSTVKNEQTPTIAEANYARKAAGLPGISVIPVNIPPLS